MEYIKTVIDILGMILSFLTLHFIFFAFVGIIRRKTYPATDDKRKYGIIIPARNEEAVVRGLIDSARKNQYPQDKLQIFVVAHNCTDRTAAVARETGVTVYEYNNPDECTMGYAFRYLFDRIREDYGIENYDGFFLFNADNILDEHYFEKMNDAFVACGGEKVITSFRNSKNFGSNLISALYGIYFAYGCRYESRGRTVCGCSTRVQGTGYVIPAELVKDGWKYVTLTEDWEFSADQLLRDRIIEYCDEAVFYDEQPTSLRVMVRQRLRWAKGHLLVCLTRYWDLLRSFFKPVKKGGGKHKFSLYDMLVNISPFCICTFFVGVMTPILYAISIFLGKGSDTLFYDWLFQPFGFIFSCVFSYSVLVLASLVLFFTEWKRTSHVSFPMKILSSFIFPFFFALSVPLEVIALFTIRDLSWKEIPHSDATTFDDLRTVNGELAGDRTDAGESDETAS